MPWKLRISQSEATDQFREFLEAAGLDLRHSNPRMDARWYNVPLADQKSGRSGGYMAYLDGSPVGFFHNHRTGERGQWKPDGDRISITHQEYERLCRYLTPFVIRLSGTADTKEVELKRAEFMLMEVVRRLFPKMCRYFDRPKLAEECKSASNLNQGRDVMPKLLDACARNGLADLKEACIFIQNKLEAATVIGNVSPAYLASEAAAAVVLIARNSRADRRPRHGLPHSQGCNSPRSSSGAGR